MKFHAFAVLTTVLLLANNVASAQSWTGQADMKLKRSEATAVDYKGELYVFNGFSQGLHVGTSIEKYNPNNKQWTLVGNTTVLNGTGVTHTHGVLVDNDVWLIGGRIGSHPGEVTDNVWKYNIPNKSWKMGPKLPTPMAGGGAALVNNKIHVFGGVDTQAKCDVDLHFVYDLGIPAQGWKNITNSARMPSGRNHFSTAVVDDIIYAIGGQHGHDGCPTKQGGNVDLVHAFDPKTNTWTARAKLPKSQSHNEPSTFVHNGFIYTAGGNKDADDVLRYDPTLNSWTQVASLPESLLAPVARIYNGALMVGGGGAPITSKSIPTVRSLELNAFNNVATGFSNTVNEASTNQVTNTNSETSTPATVGTTIGSSDGNAIAIEAESFTARTGTATHQWVESTLPNASGGNSMITNPNSGAISSNANASPKLSYSIDFEESGTYYLWIRGWGDQNAKGEGKNDSLHAGINGAISNTADKIDGFPSGWNWSNQTRDGVPAQINIPTSGVHAISIWMREDGLAVDKLILTKNSGFIPEGLGIAANSGSNVSPVENTAPVSTTPINTPSTVEVTSTTEQTETVGPTPVEVVTTTPNAVISIESENYRTKTTASNIQWINANFPDFSGTGAMVTSPNSGVIRHTANDSPMLTYSVNFEDAGIYYVWIRGWGDENSKGQGTNDSVHVGLNGALSPSADKIDGFPQGWNWSNRTRDGAPATISVPNSGTHTLNVWMREDGFSLDKIILTKQSNFTPVGLSVIENQSNSSVAQVTTVTPVAPVTPVTTTEIISSENVTSPTENTNTVVNVNAGQGSSTTIAVEAEDYFLRSGSKSHQWVSSNFSGASGSGSMITTPNTVALRKDATDSPSMSYPINFTETGKYYLWVRGWGDEKANGAGTNDSVHAGLNGELSNSADKIDGFPAGWNWSQRTRDGQVATLTVPTAGIHTVDFWMREDGLAIDKFIVTKDASFVPVGTSISASGSIAEITGTNNGTTSGTSITTGTTTGTTTSNTTTPATPANTQSSTNDTLTAIATRAWEMVQTVNGSSVVARHEAGAVAVSDNRFYVMGGRGKRPVQSFTESENKWVSHGNAPVTMHHFQPVVIDTKVYVIGALGDDNYPTEKPLTRIYIFDTKTNSWSQGAAIPQNRLRGSVGAAAYNKKIYLVGGNTLGHSGPSVPWFDEYDPANDQWKVLPNAPHARDHAAVAIADGKLVVAAGRRTAFPNVFGDTESGTDVFNFATGQWETNADDIPTKRAGTMAVSVGDEVLIIGGEAVGQSNARNNVEALNVNTGKWRKLQPLLEGRHSGGAVVLNDKVHVVTGNTTIGGGNETINHETLLLDSGP